MHLTLALAFAFNTAYNACCDIARCVITTFPTRLSPLLLSLDAHTRS